MRLPLFLTFWSITCKPLFFNLKIEAAKKSLKSIKEETSALELRNLEVMEMMTSVQLEEAELTKELMRSSARKGPIRPSGSTSELPSLVDVAKCPSDEVSEAWNCIINTIMLVQGLVWYKWMGF